VVVVRVLQPLTILYLLELPTLVVVVVVDGLEVREATAAPESSSCGIAFLRH
jgi:hypothetical protein